MNFREHLTEQLKDTAFQREFKALEPEYEIIRQVLAARSEQNLTQKELAERYKCTHAPSEARR